MRPFDGRNFFKHVRDFVAGVSPLLKRRSGLRRGFLAVSPIGGRAQRMSLLQIRRTFAKFDGIRRNFTATKFDGVLRPFDEIRRNSTGFYGLSTKFDGIRRDFTAFRRNSTEFYGLSTGFDEILRLFDGFRRNLQPLNANFTAFQPKFYGLYDGGVYFKPAEISEGLARGRGRRLQA